MYSALAEEQWIHNYSNDTDMCPECHRAKLDNDMTKILNAARRGLGLPEKPLRNIP
jgi:hypothetical protein